MGVFIKRGLRITENYPPSLTYFRSAALKIEDIVAIGRPLRQYPVSGLVTAAR